MSATGAMLANPRRSPLAAAPRRFQNPILERELLTLLRSKKAFFLLALYLLREDCVLIEARQVTELCSSQRGNRWIGRLFAISQLVEARCRVNEALCANKNIQIAKLPLFQASVELDCQRWPFEAHHWDVGFVHYTS